MIGEIGLGVAGIGLGALAIIYGMISLYRDGKEQKDFGVGSFVVCIGILILVGAFMKIAVYNEIGRPADIEQMKIGERHLVLSLAEEQNNKTYLSLKDEGGKNRFFEIEEQKIPAGLSVNDILMKIKDGTLSIHKKALTNQTMSIQ